MRRVKCISARLDLPSQQETQYEDHQDEGHAEDVEADREAKSPAENGSQQGHQLTRLDRQRHAAQDGPFARGVALEEVPQVGSTARDDGGLLRRPCI